MPGIWKFCAIRLLIHRQALDSDIHRAVWRANTNRYQRLPNQTHLCECPNCWSTNHDPLRPKPRGHPDHQRVRCIRRLADRPGIPRPQIQAGQLLCQGMQFGCAGGEDPVEACAGALSSVGQRGGSAAPLVSARPLRVVADRDNASDCDSDSAKESCMARIEFEKIFTMPLARSRTASIFPPSA